MGFKSQITSKSNISGTIGNLKIFWASENLYNNKNFSEPFLNINIFEIGDININQLPLIIEGKYLNEYNKYQIYIKNNESISKIIQFSFEKENEDIDENYILSGKTSSNEILTPLKEIKMFGTNFNFYTEKNRKLYTPLGGILTLFSVIFIFFFLIYVGLLKLFSSHDYFITKIYGDLNSIALSK